MTTAAEIVYRIRMEKAVSMSTLAEMAGVAPSTVSRIEGGRFEPTFGLLIKVIEGAGFDIHVDRCLKKGS